MRDLAKTVFHTPENFLLGNSISDWISAGIVVLATWMVLYVIRSAAAARYQRFTIAERAAAVRLVAYLAGTTKQFFIWAVALCAAGPFLDLPPRIERISSNFVLILVLLQTGIWANHAVRFYLEAKRQASDEADRSFVSSMDIIAFVARLVIWVLVVLAALDNMGVNITALLAGLGVGGIAVALALQNILGDLFASLSIALDKPFRLGDGLAVGDVTGTVEHIGIKSTRLRSPSGEQVILSNADVLKSRVRNFGRALERQALATISVAPDTPAEKLRQIPALIEQIVRRMPDARFERCHFVSIGDGSLKFELAYHSMNPAYEALMGLQQAVNFDIVEQFRAAQIEFAFPTQQLLLGKGALEPK
jgi:small-conductance mechanosensitive channel